MFFLVRHGERGDAHVAKQEERDKVEKPFDVHLTQVGHEQALKTGVYINKKVKELIEKGELDHDAKVKLVSSPYYRTLQTSKMIAEGLEGNIVNNTVYVEVIDRLV